jgi:uncharacterized protein
MKKILTLIFAFCISATAGAAAPSPESIEKLLKITQAEKMVNGMLPQIDNMMKAMTMQATQGKTMNPEEQKILDSFRAKVVATTQAEMTFDKWKPMYIDIYSRNFSQEDVNGLIAFYESAAGKAFVEKMPVVMQSIMGEMPKRLAPMMQEMQKAAEEMKKELDDLKKKQDK